MQLSERQQQTISAALTILSAAVILSAVCGLFWSLAVFVRFFSQVFLPLAVAGVAALVFQPYYNWLRSRLRLPVTLAVATMFLSLLIPAGIVGLLFGSILVGELWDFFGQLPVWWGQLQERIEQHLPELRAFFRDNPVGQKLNETVQGLGPMLSRALEYFLVSSVQAGNSVVTWSAALLGWAVAPVYFVFFLILKRENAPPLEDYLPFLKEDTRRDVVFLAREFVSIVVAFFRGQIIIAFLQGVLLAIGFRLVGLKYGLVLGFLLGFLNVIPYLGSMLGLAITLPLAYFQEGGGPGTLAGVIITLAVVQTVEGYFLTPRIMGDRTGLHPMVIIFAIFFWGTALDGIMGMILAIPLTAFLVVFWRLAKEKYIAELV